MRLRISISFIVSLMVMALLAGWLTQPASVQAIPNCPPNCPEPPIPTLMPGPTPTPRPTPTPIPEDSIENSTVWRAQIRFVTGDVGDAGTDDGISVKLRGNNKTWVDYGRDDFERGDDFTYDLVLDNIARLSDITMLQIGKGGSDGWCLKAVSLIINGRTIYSQDFGSTCRWFDNEHVDTRTYTIASSTLRAHPLWQNYRQPFPPLLIPHEEMESRVEAIMGNNIHGNDLYWGHLHGRAVEVSRTDSQTIHVDLDLAYNASFLPDPEVDVDFDLRFACSSGEISLTSQNVNVDVDSHWYYEVLSLGLIEILDHKVDNGVEGSFQAIAEMIDTGQSLCPTINVQDNGDVVFGLP